MFLDSIRFAGSFQFKTEIKGTAPALFQAAVETENSWAPYLSQIKSAERTALIIYTAIVNLFFAFYFFFFIPAFIYRFYTSFPPLVEQLIYRLSSGQPADFGLIQSIFVQLLFMALIVYLLVRMFKPFFGKFFKSKTTTILEKYAEWWYKKITCLLYFYCTDGGRITFIFPP